MDTIPAEPAYHKEDDRHHVGEIQCNRSESHNGREGCCIPDVDKAQEKQHSSSDHNGGDWESTFLVNLQREWKLEDDIGVYGKRFSSHVRYDQKKASHCLVQMPMWCAKPTP